MSTVYLDGRFMPIAEAKVSAMDRGFLYGDGAYEVIPVYSRRPFRLAEHLARLRHTLEGIRLANPHDDAEWVRLIGEIVARNEGDDQSVYLQITRGADTKRNHAFPARVAPTVYILSEPLVTPPPAQREQGIATISAPDVRWLRCDLKAISLLANCLLRQQAVDAGCVETILFRDGFMTEGAASNIFAVRDGVLLAPPKNNLMLPGITYDVVLELAAAHGLPVEVRPVAEAEARGADELWMTSSTKEVLPIVLLDGRPVGDGRPGPVFARMYAWYQDFKRTVMRAGE
ncbi:MAG: D-amino acid aminotransferase [Rhodocyclaceae bacterium]|jgi:D-alanine transaminase|nr:D-alanine aminotransferase [Rhodocyclaceae bacterium]MBZ0144955.1 D-amino acid aminotransferase [Rhodocyclaceae bacterium]MCL4680329.1 D-amino acid aminotransferase [Rhodocyclaceae bacterium]